MELYFFGAEISVGPPNLPQMGLRLSTEAFLGPKKSREILHSEQSRSENGLKILSRGLEKFFETYFHHSKNLGSCGEHDDDDFKSNEMCCACGGGSSGD